MMYKTFKYNTLIILLPCSYFEMYIWNTQIMKTAAFFVLILYLITLLCLLKEAAIWYFGESAGLDFNSGIPLR
jgi:hypothetical protein